MGEATLDDDDDVGFDLAVPRLCGDEYGEATVDDIARDEVVRTRPRLDKETFAAKGGLAGFFLHLEQRDLPCLSTIAPVILIELQLAQIIGIGAFPLPPPF